MMGRTTLSTTNLPIPHLRNLTGQLQVNSTYWSLRQSDMGFSTAISLISLQINVEIGRELV